MRRPSTGSTEHVTYREMVAAGDKELRDDEKEKKHEMKRGWEEVDEGWAMLNKKMVQVGIESSKDVADNTLKLNVGGAPVDLCRSSLSGSRYLKQSRLCALLMGMWGNRCLPRSSDDRIVLDESPACLLYLMNMLLGKGHSFLDGGSNAAAMDHFNVGSPDPSDDAYLAYLEDFLGLMAHDDGALALDGRSMILGVVSKRAMLHQLQAWLPGAKSKRMELLYRASRDGFTPASFHLQCDIARSSIILIKVCNPSGTVSSVVGGFSSTSWAQPTATKTRFKESADAFIFLLQDGLCEALPTKWAPEVLIDNHEQGDCDAHQGGRRVLSLRKAVYCSSAHGPQFGDKSLGCSLMGPSMCSFLTVKRTTYHLGDGANSAERAFLSLDGARIVEIEVYSLDDPTITISTEPKPVLETVYTPFFAEHIIPSSLTRQSRYLENAKAELAEAKTAIEAATKALEAIYGPQVAAGKRDPVVEFSVRGEHFTTLRSTLQACPESVLAIRFNGEIGPSTKKDRDNHGRHVLDCDPFCFGKILDVLRIRKREAWNPMVHPINDGDDDTDTGTQGKGTEDSLAYVVVPKRHQVAFDTLVRTYFKGYEDFVNGLVQHKLLPTELKSRDEGTEEVWKKR